MEKEKELSEKNPLATTSNPVRKCSDCIPVDLLIDIFSRVPSKSIARFRCVSKLWSYVLDDRPDFTELFLSKSWTRPLFLFTLVANGKYLFYSSPQPRSINKDTCLVATRYPTYFPKDSESFFHQFTLVTGLVFLHQGYSFELCETICNPATGESLTLPKVEGDDSVRDLYLGYDPINKQFKVLCMFKGLDTHMVSTLDETGKPSSWRSIDYKFRFAWDLRMVDSNICINGVLYFGANLNDDYWADPDSDFTVIVSFDVRSEKFVFINNVEEDMFEATSWRYGSMTLFNFEGKLAILDSKGLGSYRHQRECVVWVLEDAGNHKWSKHVFTLPYFYDMDINKMRFVRMTATGDLVWSPNRVSNPFYLHFFSLETKQFTSVNVKGFEEFKEDDDIKINTSLGYEENITKKSTWSHLKHTPNVDISCKNKAEKRMRSNNNNNNSSSIPTSNRFDILDSL